MHLLLIEDNLDLSANVGEFLESRGNTVDYARDGMQGLQLAGGEGYDAVILDLGLPGLDGLDAVPSPAGYRAGATFRSCC